MKVPKIYRYVFVGVCGATIIFFYAASAPAGRTALALFFEKNGRYEEAARIYKTILRKNDIKKDMSKAALSAINLSVSQIYARLGLSNLAVESLSRVIPVKSGIEKKNRFFEDDIDKDKLFGLGAIEGGKPDEAIRLFNRIRPFYTAGFDISLINAYISVASGLKGSGLAAGSADFYFKIGDLYIANRLYSDARQFYTRRIIDYGVNPVSVLYYIREKYSQNAEIVKNVWGDDIYVTLEDFEGLDPKFHNWVSNITGKIYSHRITREAARRGLCSEFYDIVYSGTYQGPDPSWGGDYYYLAKVVSIPLKPHIGLRMYVKSEKSRKCSLCFNAVYPSSNTSGIGGNFSVHDAGNGWYRYEINDLYGDARTIASSRGWSTEGMMMDKVIFDAKGFTGIFFIDEVELFLN